MKHYQQGDVLLFKTDSLSGEVLKTKVVQEGEHTGHAHRFSSGEATIYGIGSERRFIRVKGTATMTHEEHLPTIIEEGDYEIKIIRQKDPFTKLIAKVVD